MNDVEVGLASNFWKKKYNMNDPQVEAGPQLLASKI